MQQVVHEAAGTSSDGSPATLSYYLDGAHTAESLATCAHWFADATREEATGASPGAGGASPQGTQRILVFNCLPVRTALPSSVITTFAPFPALVVGARLKERVRSVLAADACRSGIRRHCCRPSWRRCRTEPACRTTRCSCRQTPPTEAWPSAAVARSTLAGSRRCAMSGTATSLRKQLR